MQQGKVKHYNHEKGYGFIKADDGQEVFFHITGLDKSWGQSVPEKDNVVTFEVVDGDRGPKAINVTSADAVGGESEEGSNEESEVLAPDFTVDTEEEDMEEAA